MRGLPGKGSEGGGPPAQGSTVDCRSHTPIKTKNKDTNVVPFIYSKNKGKKREPEVGGARGERSGSCTDRGAQHGWGATRRRRKRRGKGNTFLITVAKHGETGDGEEEERQ